MNMSKEELAEKRARHKPKIGDRVSYIIPERGGWSHGFGDVIKLNRVTVEVIDRKFEHADKDGIKILIDRALLTKVECK